MNRSYYLKNCIKQEQAIKAINLSRDKKEQDVTQSNRVLRNGCLMNQVNSSKNSKERIKVFDVFNNEKSIVRDRTKSNHQEKKSFFVTKKLETGLKKRSISNLIFKESAERNLFKVSDQSISYIKQKDEPKQRFINIKKIKNENILDLLLLNTMDLKSKLSSARHHNNSFIRIRPGKLPSDFFQK
ncbi:hypothetical protein pb186bvf_013257 [Paramecium bursaria]